MVDAISVSAIILSSITALGGVIAGIHIKRMRSGCCESECFDKQDGINQDTTIKKTCSSLSIETQPNLSTV